MNPLSLFFLALAVIAANEAYKRNKTGKWLGPLVSCGILLLVSCMVWGRTL